ncbi:uncharacterized protein PB18E9.04c-like [Lingula anatina]|uniref:Uncharacterized protein PB18E9.04c-like n=1 Tax=Lingula anatina TaxID=7574 RepID=A0A1S3HPC0_LINAN|nr:uncharacterized protein PB18E9.04c-like [Lingula anatina]|eukprot:XP_013387386.1 uncharacterized protein PB18E9.04c-like [Lingula anatina]
MLVEKSCIVGLNFSPDDGNCVWPSQYACPTPTTTTSTTAPYTGTGSTTPGVTSTTTCTHGNKYVHSSGDCNRYLSCANGILLEQSCLTGLFFSPDDNSCVWPSDYTCPTTTATTTTTAPYKGTATPTTPGVRSTTTCTNGQNYVHPSGDCTIYLTCSNGMLVETSCTAGLNFSPIDGNCVWANQYACPTTTPTTSTMAPYTGPGTSSTPAVTSTTTCNHGQSYVHPSGDCTRYLTCSNGILLDDSCTEGLNYSPDENYCVWPSQYACPTTTSSTTKAISYTETGTTTTASTAPYTWTDTVPTTTTTTTAPYTGTGSTTPRTVTPTTPGVTSTTTCTRDGQNYVHPQAPQGRHHHEGTTMQAPPGGHHHAGTTRRAPPCRHHQPGTTMQAPPGGHHQPGTTMQAPLGRHHHAGTTRRAPPLQHYITGDRLSNVHMFNLNVMAVEIQSLHIFHDIMKN